MPIYITYDNTSLTDGIGSQVHRIIGLLALARTSGLRYLHTPIVKVNNQGWQARQTNVRDEAYVAKWDQFLRLGYGLPTPENCGIKFSQTVSRRKATRSFIKSLKEDIRRPWWDLRREQNVLVRILSPYKTVHRHPDNYEAVCGDLRAWYQMFPKPPISYHPEKLNVAVHVRRGDINVLEQHAKRLAPNAVYLAAMRQVMEFAGAERVHFHIFSEGDYNCPMNRFEEFRIGPHVTFHLDEDVFSTFHHLVNADVLVMSKSNLSYVAGLYSPGLMLYVPYWFPPLSRWLPLLDSGDAADTDQLHERLARVLSSLTNRVVWQGEKLCA